MTVEDRPLQSVMGNINSILVVGQNEDFDGGH